MIHFFLILILFFTGCNKPHSDQLPIVLGLVNGYAIRADELLSRIALEEDKYPEKFFNRDEQSQLIKKQTLDLIIQNRILIDWGKKQGIILSENEKAQGMINLKSGYTDKEFEAILTEKGVNIAQWAAIAEDKLYVEKILNETIYKNIKVTPEEVKNYYEKNKEEFKITEQVRVRHIVTDTLDKAKVIEKALLSGENFAKLAILHSLSPDRANGGDLGFFEKGTHPVEFDEACFKLKSGEISPIVKSPYGYHLFKLIDKRSQGFLPLAEVYEQIVNDIFKKKMEEKFKAWYEDIQKQAQVQIVEDALAKLKIN